MANSENKTPEFWLIRRRMAELGWRYSDLAKATGYAEGTIKNIARGRHHSARSKLLIEKAMNIKIWIRDYSSPE